MFIRELSKSEFLKLSTLDFCVIGGSSKYMSYMPFFFCFVEGIGILTPGVLNGKSVLLVMAMQTEKKKKRQRAHIIL